MTPPQPGSIGDRQSRGVGYVVGQAVGLMIVLVSLATLMVLIVAAALWAIRSALGWCA